MFEMMKGVKKQFHSCSLKVNSNTVQSRKLDQRFYCVLPVVHIIGR